MADERLDDWTSSTSSLGGIRDKHRGLSFARRDRLPRIVLDAMYEQNPVVATIVDKIVDDAFRGGWTLKSVITSDGSDVDVKAVRSGLDDLGVDLALSTGAKWSRLHGGALVVTPVLFSGAPNKPLKMTRKTPMLRLGVVSAERAIPLAQDVGLFSPTYGRVLEYQVTGLASSSIDVHYSRAIPFEPVKLPIETLLSSGARGWGPSVIERVFDDIGRDGAAASHAVSMMYVSSILALQMDGYRAEHTTKGGAAKIRKMLADVRENLDAFGILGLDVKDKISAISLAIAGVHELLDRMRDRVAAATVYPREILFKESPTGLRGGELTGAQELYYAEVAAWQRETLEPALDQILELYFAWKGIPAVEWEIEFLPLFTKSDAASSDIHAKNATADHQYIEDGVVTAAEVREHRIVQGNAGPLAITEQVEEPLDLDIDPTEIAAHELASAPAPDAAATPADQAMTGIQVSSLKELAMSVKANELPRASALAIVRVGFPSAANEAENIIPPEPVPVPGAAPVVAPGADEVEPPPDPGAPPSDPASPQAAAQAWGVPTRTITLLIQRGTLPYWGIGSRRIVSLSAVGRLAKAHEEIVEPDAAALDALPWTRARRDALESTGALDGQATD